MTLHRDLLETAQRLAVATTGRPRQADLRRAVSTAYYATFHALARECADRFVGTNTKTRSPQAWTQTYRALDHRRAKNAWVQEGRKLGFPPEVTQFAESFISLQEERHKADYDPDHRYTRAEAVLIIADAEQAINDLANASVPDRAAFAALVLLQRRNK